MRFFAYVVLPVIVAVGCGDASVARTPPDVERDASVDPDGGVDLDGSIDGGLDGGTDGGPQDAGPDGGEPDGGGSWCQTSRLCPSCSDLASLCDDANPCPVGEACLPTGCEDFSRCFVIGGGACENDQDCGDPEYECNVVVGRCLRKEPGCADSTDCVAGFACEDGVCVDRRVPCFDLVDCPHGYACVFTSPDQRFCRRITRPCSDDLDCLVLGVPCGDADDDGRRECMPSLKPNEPDATSCDVSQCVEPEAPVCEITADGLIATCGRFGLCSAPVQCPVGFLCRDLWGDGRTECVAGPGSCVDSSECAIREVCGSPRDGGAPRCIGETMF